MGRPTKLDQALIDAIVADVERGIYIETVADLNGIHPSTFYTWLNEGDTERARQRDGAPHPKGRDRSTKDRLRLCAVFSEAVARACATVEAGGVDVWRSSFEIREVLRVDGEPVLDADGNAKTVVVGTDWRAVQAYMERRFPSRWKNRTEQALTGADGGPIQTQGDAKPDLSKLSADELRTLMALTQKTQPDADGAG